jgi:hypothetical protein
MKGRAWLPTKLSIFRRVATKLAASTGNAASPITTSRPTRWADHRVELVRLVTDPAIVSDGYPALRACALQPFFIGGVRREELGMADDRESCLLKNVRKLPAEIAIGEECRAHAAARW